ncbi:MAG TPA: type II secretion system F family protein [Hyphomicrobiales bacterium]|nr:type II secretion system F family protein [Hyphomicrobiales bacterium]
MAATAREAQIFTWRAQDARGVPQEGETSSTQAALLKAQLQRQGLRHVRIRRKAVPLFTPRQVRSADLALFTRQLATMMQAGIPLLQSFDIAATALQAAALRELAHKLRAEVATGTALSQALRQHPRHFDRLFCNLVAAGEQSGTLDLMLERLAQHKERSEALKARLKKALRYPLIVTVVALLASGILLVKVVPQFAASYAGLGAQLPAFTRGVLALSDAVGNAWHWLLLGGVLTIAAFRQLLARSPAWRERLERLALHLPLCGAVLRQAIHARVSRTLATTLGAGLPLVEALQASAAVAGNSVYRDALLKVREDVTTGLALTHALRLCRLFAPMLLQLVAIGEESGSLHAMLDKCASHYETAVNDALDGLATLVEPLVMAILGLLVGALMVALYLPIFQLGAAF